MSMDQLIRESEPDFRQHAVDKERFKQRLFESINGRVVPRKNRWFTWKKGVVLPIFVILPLFGTAAGAAVYKWHTTWNTRMHATNADATNAAVAYIAPFWKTGYLTSMYKTPISFVDLQTSRSEAGFSIREPKNVPGWANVFSKGFVEAKTTPLEYLDVYQNSNGERVSVLQQNSGNHNQSQQVILDYPQSAQNLTDFSPDLAVYVSGRIDGQPKATANELDIYHKNTDNTVTEFEIAGTVPEQTLETIANAYLQAPK